MVHIISRAVLAGALCLLVLVPAAEAKPATVKVMTRNLYLGADLLPGTRAQSIQELVNIAGGVMNDVDRNDFRTRAKGLAAEILKERPDLVGLQEASLWRTQPCDRAPLPPSAPTVRYDYLQLLLAELNKGGKRYRLAAVKNQFDFEIWANTDGNESTSAPNCPNGSEINGRLTMRDAILARVGSARTSRPRTGTFRTLLSVRPAGVGIDVTRGWTSVDALVRGKSFRFVNAHLEAYDNQPTGNRTNRGESVDNGRIREAQAKQLVGRGGAATGRLPVVLLADVNSGQREIKPGDALAFRAILRAGFARRSPERPYSCCLDADVLTVDGGGNRSNFNHTIDYILTDAPRRVRLVDSVVTGLSPVNGFWNADHAGVVSSLRFR